MSKKTDQNLRSVSSFSDFVNERKRLKLKRKLIETRLQFNAEELKEMVSLNRNISFDLIRNIIQQFSGIFERILRSDTRAGTNDTSSGT